MVKDHKSVGATDREAESVDHTVSDNLPKQAHRDWLPVAILGVVIVISIIIFVRLVFMFFAAAPEQKITPKIFVKKLGQVKKEAKQEKKQKLKLERDQPDPDKKKIAKVQGESPALTPGRDYNGQDTNGLIAFYPFNGNAHDESGNGNHGTVHGATPAEDRFGNGDSAYRFDGVDDYIDMGRPLVSGNFTISFWLRSNGRQNPFAVPISQGNMGYRGFNFTFTKGLYNGFSWGTWKEKKVPDPNWGKSAWHTLDFHFQKDINSDITWHHLVATQKGNIIKIYRDGKSQGSASNFPINYGQFKFNIGRASENWDFNHRSFNGVIDDVRIYNKALTEEEIQGLYKEGGYKG